MQEGQCRDNISREHPDRLSKIQLLRRITVYLMKDGKSRGGHSAAILATQFNVEHGEARSHRKEDGLAKITTRSAWTNHNMYIQTPREHQLSCD